MTEAAAPVADLDPQGAVRTNALLETEDLRKEYGAGAAKQVVLAALNFKLSRAR